MRATAWRRVGVIGIVASVAVLASGCSIEELQGTLFAWNLMLEMWHALTGWTPT